MAAEGGCRCAVRSNRDGAAARRELLDRAALVALLLGRGRGRAARVVVAAASFAAPADGRGEAEIAARHRPALTAGKALRQLGLSCPAGSQGRRSRAGELLHVDIGNLGLFWWPGKPPLAERRTLSRGASWQFLYVAVDDHSRWPTPKSCPPERPSTRSPSCAALRAGMPNTTSRSSKLMADNGTDYVNAAGGRPVANWSCGPAPTRRAPTARPSG